MASTGSNGHASLEEIRDIPNGAVNGHVPDAEVPLHQRPALYNWKTTNERGYTIKETLSGKRRPLKVICAGAGASGICLAKFIKDDAENVDLVVYEKNSDIGGTWLENRYRESESHFLLSHS